HDQPQEREPQPHQLDPHHGVQMLDGLHQPGGPSAGSRHVGGGSAVHPLLLAPAPSLRPGDSSSSRKRQAAPIAPAALPSSEKCSVPPGSSSLAARPARIRGAATGSSAASTGPPTMIRCGSWMLERISSAATTASRCCSTACSAALSPRSAAAAIASTA